MKAQRPAHVTTKWSIARDGPMYSRLPSRCPSGSIALGSRSIPVTTAAGDFSPSVEWMAFEPTPTGPAPLRTARHRRDGAQARRPALKRAQYLATIR